MCLPAYWQWKLANECARISAPIVKVSIALKNFENKKKQRLAHAATLTSINNRIDSEQHSQSENGIRDRTLVDLYLNVLV